MKPIHNPTAICPYMSLSSRARYIYDVWPCWRGGVVEENAYRFPSWRRASLFVGGTYQSSPFGRSWSLTQARTEDLNKLLSNVDGPAIWPALTGTGMLNVVITLLFERASRYRSEMEDLVYVLLKLAESITKLQVCRALWWGVMCYDDDDDVDYWWSRKSVGRTAGQPQFVFSSYEGNPKKGRGQVCGEWLMNSNSENLKMGMFLMPA